MASKRNQILKGWCDIPVANLRKAEWNYKGEDGRISEKLLAGLKRDGQIETILVRYIGDGLYEVVNGNHRLDQFEAAGIESAHCYSLGKVNVTTAKRLAITLNETRFKANEAALGQIVDELLQVESVDILEETMPFSKDDLLDMQGMVNFDWDQFKGQAPKTTKNRHQHLKFELTDEQYDQWRKVLELLIKVEKTKSETHAFIRLLELGENALQDG